MSIYLSSILFFCSISIFSNCFSFSLFPKIPKPTQTKITITINDDKGEKPPDATHSCTQNNASRKNPKDEENHQIQLEAVLKTMHQETRAMKNPPNTRRKNHPNTPHNSPIQHQTPTHTKTNPHSPNTASSSNSPPPLSPKLSSRLPSHLKHNSQERT